MSDGGFGTRIVVLSGRKHGKHGVVRTSPVGDKGEECLSAKIGFVCPECSVVE
jgi:hypothetical protein